MTLIENFTIVVDAARVVSTSDAAQVQEVRIENGGERYDIIIMAPALLQKLATLAGLECVRPGESMSTPIPLRLL